LTGLVRRWQQQCERFVTLEPRLPAILLGKEKPADAAEQIEFAQLCSRKKLYAPAARLYAAAFALKPDLAEGLRTGNRYYAACLAALAGCSRSSDGVELGDAERARWRTQARQWLRADLDARATSRACAIRTRSKDYLRPNAKNARRCGTTSMPCSTAPGIPNKPCGPGHTAHIGLSARATNQVRCHRFGARRGAALECH
jgi:hypothetical protein